jgi:alpha-L-arabinofuranosidase
MNVKLEKFEPSLNTKIPDLSATNFKSSDNKIIYLMVINKNLGQDIETEIILNNFTSNGLANT